MEKESKAARDLWAEASKIQKKLNHIIEILQREENADMRRYEQLDEVIAKHRLACIQVLALDPEFFCETAQGPMWNVHSSINTHYRQILAHLRGSRAAAVSRGKIERLHVRFLKTSFDFYKRFVQQLAAKYGIPELQKAARKTSSVPDGSAQIPANRLSPSLQSGLLHSCTMAIVHMGDLTRYLAQARPRKSKTKDHRTDNPAESHASQTTSKALEPYAYHELASQLMPSLGHPHHQIAVALLDEKNDFDVVFHFIKAVAVERPHPLASQNLEQKLKMLRTTEAQAPIASQDGATIFKTWFVRLLGAYHGGEGPSDRRGAMETEFLGRLKKAIGTDHDSQVIVNKMALINISAHYLAKKKLIDDPENVKAGITLESILRFNIVFFGTLLDHLKWALGQLKRNQSQWDMEHPDGKPIDENDKRPRGDAELYTCLPPVRLYASWLVATANEINNSPQRLQPLVTGMLEFFAQVLTQLSDIYASEDMKITPYLLPEDMLGRGMFPLNSAEVPMACLLSYDQEAGRSKVDMEDYQETHGLWNPDREILSRVLDILFCGYHVVESTAIPLKWTQHETETLKFFYEPVQEDKDYLLEANPILSHPTQGAMQGTPLNNGAGAFRDPNHQGDGSAYNPGEVHDLHPGQHQYSGIDKRGSGGYGKQLWEKDAQSHGQAAGVKSGYSALADVQGSHQRTASQNYAPMDTPKASGDAQIWGSKLTVGPSNQQQPEFAADSTDYDFTDNTAVMSMVNDFLQPPGASQAAKRPHPVVSLEETSYGMHSSTANEVFNGMGSRSPGASAGNSPRAFPGLPWNLVYSPTPNAAEPHMSGPPGLSKPSKAATASADPQRLGSAFGAMALRDGSSIEGYGGSPQAQQWPQYGASADGSDAASHRARLLQAFGQPSLGSPVASASTARSRTTSQEHANVSQQYPQTGFFPNSSDPAFSDPSNLYQGTPYAGGFNPFAGATVYGRGPRFDVNEDPTSFKNQSKARGMGDVEEYADAYNSLIYQSVRDDTGKEDGMKNRFG